MNVFILFACLCCQAFAFTIHHLTGLESMMTLNVKPESLCTRLGFLPVTMVSPSCTQGMFDWVDILDSKLDSMSPVGTDLETVKQQIVELKVQ